MEHRTLGRTNYSVSVLGFGAAPVGLLNTDRERAASMLNWMLDHGVNLIDTAAGYAGSEELIGQTVSHRRKDFVLVSKCGREIDEVKAPAWSEKTILGTVDRALKRLKTDRLDVMLLHSCDLETLKKGEALGALVKAREAGKIAHAGYSGDNEAAAHAVTLPDVAVLETSVNIADQANIDGVLPLAKRHNVGVIAKRPIANAAWKDLSQQPGFYKDYAKTYTERLGAMKIEPGSFGVSGADAWPELALRFTLAQSVHTAIIGTTNPDNAHLNVKLAEKVPLSADAVEKLRRAFRAANPDGSWTGQT